MHNLVVRGIGNLSELVLFMHGGYANRTIHVAGRIGVPDLPRKRR